MRTWLSRLLDVVLRRRRDDRLSEEVQSHLDLLVDEHVARGLSLEEARLAARRSFGGVDQVKQRYRDQRGVPGLETLLQDGRFAIRVLTRDRGFAITAVLVLAVGIGVNNMFFTVVYAHKFRGLPIDRPDRVLAISAFDDRGSNRPVSPAELDDLRSSQRQFEGLAGYVNGVVTVGDTGRAPDRFDAAYVSANAFPLIGRSPLMGRLPTAAEDRAGAEPIVLLGAGVWQSRYGGDPAILGRTILINGSPATVAGVIADQSGFPSTAQVWLPLGQFQGLSPNRDARRLQVFGRLRDGALESDARAEIEAAYARFETAYPETNRNLRARVLRLHEHLLGDLTGWGPFVMAGVIVVLVACANVANLMIARAMHRAPELAIRTSLGASRARIVRQLLVEAAVLAGIGGAIGGVLGFGGVRLFESAIPDGMLPYWFDYSMDGRVLAALVMISLATIVVFGLIPAMQASKTDVNRVLKDGGRSGIGRVGGRVWSTVFLSLELALAMIMLSQVAVGTLGRSQSIPTDANIDSTAVITSMVTLPGPAYPTPTQREDFFRRLHERLAARPEIVAVSRATALPGDGPPPRLLEIEGRQTGGADQPRVATIEIAPAYFATLALGVVRGRDFTAADVDSGDPVAIVNDRFAAVFLDGRDPIGTRIALPPPNAPAGSPPQWRSIVCVSPLIRQQGPGGGGVQEPPIAYLPIAASSPATSTLMVRHTTDPMAAASLMRAEAQAVDPNIPMYRMRTLAAALHDAQWNQRVSAYLAGTVSFLAVLLATVGLYGVTTHRVTLQTREIGLRMALGARAPQLVRLVLGGLRVPLALGLVLGVMGAVAWDRAYSSGVAGLAAGDPKTLLQIAALVTVIVVAACGAPLRRAMTTNPVTALRQD